MKIKCSQCSFENLERSKFCQECGYELSSKEPKAIGKTTSFHEEIERIDDVIFRPKKEKGVLKRILLWVFILGTVSFVGLIVLTSLSSEGNNTTTIQTEPAIFPISYLDITDYKIIYDDAGESYFVGVLKNAYSKAARNVKVRLDFFYDEAMKKHFDSRSVVIENGVEPNGAFSFQKQLYFYPIDNYWWIWKIESADYGL